MLLSPGAERRSNTERRSGVDRRAGAERRAASPGGADSRPLPSHGFSTEPVPLGRVLPHARFNGSEAAERPAAIAAPQHALSARLERTGGLSVAALDYLLNISRDLVANIEQVIERRNRQADIALEPGAEL